MPKSAAIAFVPLNFVRVSWTGLKTEMPDDDKFERYTAYFDEHSLMVTLDHAYGTTTDTGMNNHLEGWYNRMKRISRRHTLTSVRC